MERERMNRYLQKINLAHNGLRNRVIHEYNKTDDQKVKDSIENLVVPLKKILEKLSEFIEKIKDEKN